MDESRGVIDALKDIARKLDKPFSDVHEDRRNDRLVHSQEKISNAVKQTAQSQEKIAETQQQIVREMQTSGKWQKTLIIFTLTVGAISLVISLWTATINNNTATLQAELYSEKAAVKIDSNNAFEDILFFDSRDNIIKVPLKIGINNYGLIPVQIYNITYAVECPVRRWARLNENIVVEPGKSYETSEQASFAKEFLENKAQQCIFEVDVATASQVYKKQFRLNHTN